MANGARIGRRAELGQVAHTDGNATTVVSLPIPSAEGYYHVFARFCGGAADGSGMVSGTVQGALRWNGSLAIISNSTQDVDMGATGYTVTLTEDNANVMLQIAAANGHRSVASLEIFGVEFDLTLA